jgi:hypothetical protein
MKTLRLLGMIGLGAVLSLSFAACSSDDDPVIEEEETFIEGKLPSNIHVGMIYPISHDKKNDVCIFGIYLGENPPQEMIAAMELEKVFVHMYDRYDNEYQYKEYGYNYNPVKGNYTNGLNIWNDEKRHWEFRHDNTITVACVACEFVTKIKISFDGPTLLEYYPELANMDDVYVNKEIWPNPGAVAGLIITQSWSSPHHWYY